MHTEAGRAEDFWSKVKNKVRKNISGGSSGKHRKEEPRGSNPGGFMPGRGKHRQDESGGASPGKHRKERQPGKHRADSKPHLFSQPSGKHVRDDGASKPQSAPGGNNPGRSVGVPSTNEQSDQNTPRGRYRAETGERAPKTDGNDQIEKSRVRARPPRPKLNLGTADPTPKTSDPLTDPGHKVDKSMRSPIHDQLHVDSQNPLTAPGRHSNPNDPTPTHDDANVSNQLNQRLKGRPNKVREVKNPGDAKNMSKDELRGRRPRQSAFIPREAASGLDQIQQTINVHDAPDPREMPSGVAFPIVNEEWAEETTEGSNYAEDKNSEYRSKSASRQAQVVKNLAAKMRREAEILYKMADQFGADDSPNAVPGGSAANSPMTTPPEPAGKSFDDGFEDGVNDKRAGERPAFSDASSSAPDYVQGYSEGYSVTPAQHAPENVPGSLGGDSGQVYNSQRADERGQTGEPTPLSMGASLTVAASFTEPEAAQYSDFRKGYNYGWSWTPQRRMVSLGSTEFEAGLYAGITDNPEYQREFVETNKRHASLSDRLSNHRGFTQYLLEQDHSYYGRGLYVQGSTSTDLNIMGPGVGPDPMGQTPSMGIGEDPPNKDGEDPAREGGPAPYNAAPPFGQGPAVENPVMGPPQDEPSDHARQAAFRARVQANLRNRRGQR